MKIAYWARIGMINAKYRLIEKVLKPNLIGIITVMMLLCSARAELYPTTFIVDAVDMETDVIELVDANGFIWEFNGVEDYHDGDVVAAIMDDNNTDVIFDDTIEVLRFIA